MKPNYFNTIFNYVKLVLGLALTLIPLSISILILIISYPNESVPIPSEKLLALVHFFGGGNDGGASNAPIMFGLMVLGGVFLLNSLKKDKVNV